MAVPRGMNGMTNDIRYREQQEQINLVCEEIGCVPFRPDYHGKTGDGNTVLVYLPEDEEHNREVDKEPTHYGSADEARHYGCTDERYYYRPYVWYFENTDANGLKTLDFGNRGQIDLRGLAWKEALEGSIKLAFYRKMQAAYAASQGGLFAIREADDTYNGYNVLIAKAFRMAYGRAYIGKITLREEEKKAALDGTRSPLREYEKGSRLYNFGADFVVPCRDEMLEKLIIRWNRDGSPVSLVADIQTRIYRLHGEQFVWY